MTGFLSLTDMKKAVLVSLLLLSILVSLFLLLTRWLRLRRLRGCLFPGTVLLLLGLDLLFLKEALSSRIPSGVGLWLGTLPWALHLFLVGASILYCAVKIRGEQRIEETEITPESVREALDNLPSALCFSDENGIPLLTNRRLYELAEDAMGHIFRNAGEFWRELSGFTSGNGLECVQNGERPTLLWPDGSLWQFSRTELCLSGKRYIQTTGTDITKHDRLSRELTENNTILSNQRKRLKKLMDELVWLQREEEILASKMRIHSELGRCLLVSRRLLIQDHDKDAAQVLSLWKEMIGSLEHGAGGGGQGRDSSLSQLMDAAAALGCAIEWKGEPPKNEAETYLLMTAVREAAVNAVRHAGADRLIVELWEENGIFFAEITDNGTARPASITEGGGLQTLRRWVEQAGGALEVRCDQGVRLYLRLRTGKGEAEA